MSLFVLKCACLMNVLASNAVPACIPVPDVRFEYVKILRNCLLFVSSPCEFSESMSALCFG